MLCVADPVPLPLILELVTELVTEFVTLSLSLALRLELWLEPELAEALDSKLETVTTAVAVIELTVDNSVGTVVLNSSVMGAIGANPVVAGVFVPMMLVSGC